MQHYKRYDIKKVSINEVNNVIAINEVNNVIAINEYLIDLRAENEFKEGRLPNSINVPFLHMKDWASKNIRNVNTRIYLYCQNGARSVHAASALRKMGFTSVIDLGGLNAYNGKLVNDN